MDIDGILGRISSGTMPETEEIAYLLSAEGDEKKVLFDAARKVRDDNFGKRIFVYGFVYFSTHCRNDCAFCNYRSSKDMHRYRKSIDQILQLSQSLEDAGVNLVDLTMGEDPYVYMNDGSFLASAVSKIREKSDIGIMVSPGAVEDPVLKNLADAGADWLALYQETYDRGLFSKLRLNQDFDFRLSRRKSARDLGMLVEDGILVGSGDTMHSRAKSVLQMGSEANTQIRAMAFVPQQGTPMENYAPGAMDDELRTIAVMRLLFPDRLIPASLDVEGISGLKTRMDAGANVITSVIPPFEELAGVAQPELDIENGGRSVDHVRKLVSDMGMYVASQKEYREFIDGRKEAQKCL